MVKVIRVQPIGHLREEVACQESSIYHCIQKGVVVYTPNTEQGALQWLSDNGGGIYKNTLHQYQFEVKPDEYKNLIP